MPPSQHKIPLSIAVSMTSRARAAAIIPVHAWKFSRDIYDSILSQPGVMGIRSYFALDSNGQPTLVIVGTDASDKDMVNDDIGEMAWPCPPYCDPESPLLTGP